MNPSEPKVGDTLYISGQNRNPSYEAVVVKVGRKWAYVCKKDRFEEILSRNGGEFDFERHKSNSRRYDFTDERYIRNGSFSLDAGGYTSPGTVYESYEQWRRVVIASRLWSAFRQGLPFGLEGRTASEIRAAAQILNVELPSDEELVPSKG